MHKELNNQSEMIKTLFNRDFISQLETEDTKYCYEFIDSILSEYLEGKNYIEHEEAITDLLTESYKDFFELGVDFTLTLLGYPPAFNH